MTPSDKNLRTLMTMARGSKRKAQRASWLHFAAELMKASEIPAFCDGNTLGPIPGLVHVVMGASTTTGTRVTPDDLPLTPERAPK